MLFEKRRAYYKRKDGSLRILSRERVGAHRRDKGKLPLPHTVGSSVNQHLKGSLKTKIKFKIRMTVLGELYKRSEAYSVRLFIGEDFLVNHILKIPDKIRFDYSLALFFKKVNRFPQRISDENFWVFFRTKYS